MNRFSSARLADLSAARGDAFVSSLIGGFTCSKNDSVDGGKRITGENLLDLIYQQLEEVRSRIGGRVVFIECGQGVPKLTAFYGRNGFAKFDSRVSKVDGKTYDMMFRFLPMS